MTHADRRIHPRINVSIEIFFDLGMESFTEFTINLSPGGLYVKTNRPLDIGSIITAKFALPGFDHSFNIQGKVVWKKTYENEEGPPGMGIEFIDQTRENEAVLLQYVARSQLTQKGY